jgi:preprotein translocase subunit SecF
MEFFKIRKDIPFMKHAVAFNAVSFITFVAAVFFLFSRGLHLSVEFTGGTLMEVSYSQPADLNAVRDQIAKLGFSDVQVQNFGTARDVMIRMPAVKGQSSAQQSEQVLTALKATDANVQLRRTEFVGPQVGDELAVDGLKALAFVVVGIMIYLAMRFEWKFAVAAIIANLHDVVIILGFFAFFQWEFSLPVLAAVLAVLGYSVNESVVIFDRIRENFRRYRKMDTVEIIDNAITSTISRTIITHGCTQLMVLSMLLFGGATLHYFALALTIGICFGIYSSVFVAAAIAMWLGIRREDRVLWFKPCFKPLNITRKSRFSNRLFYACVTAGMSPPPCFVLQVTEKRVYPFATQAFGD